jgi:putative transcriptional regulator
VVFDFIRSRPLCAAQLLALACLVLVLPVAPATLEPAGTRNTPGGTSQAALLAVQRSRIDSLAKGKLLVASNGLRDPNFAETVILLVEYNEQGAMGVILNRATRVKLSELLPKVKGLEQRGDAIYEGGPVERSEILMLLRAAQEPEHSLAVFADVYLSSSADLLKRLAAEPSRDSAPFRVYSGYAGWASGQLEAEVGAGGWHIFPATAAVVFAPQTENLWREFIGRATLRLARGWRYRWSPV